MSKNKVTLGLRMSMLLLWTTRQRNSCMRTHKDKPPAYLIPSLRLTHHLYADDSQYLCIHQQRVYRRPYYGQPTGRDSYDVWVEIDDSAAC